MTTSEIIEAREALPVQTRAPATTQDLILVALERGADIAVLERLMTLQERDDERKLRMLALDAEKAFVAAMSAFKAEPLVIYKNKEVGYTDREGKFVGYKHATLSDVTAEVVPAMSRHGLSHRWDLKQQGGIIRVDCIITHVMGHSERVSMETPPDTSGKKNPIQAIASATSYLERYTLLAVTGMATTDVHDDDGRGSSGEPGAADDRQAPPPAPAPIDGLEDMTAERFEEKAPEWNSLIQSGTATADRVLKNLRKKFNLTDDQEKTLRSFEQFDESAQ